MAAPVDLGGAAVVAVQLDVFTRSGCPHCAQAKVYLQKLQKRHPTLTVVEHRVDQDPEAAQLLMDRLKERHISVVGVPTFVIGKEVVVGFESEDTTGAQLAALVAREGETRPSLPTPTDFGCPLDMDDDCAHPPTAPPPELGRVETRWFGEVSLQRLGLPLFTIVLGLLDGFNPCAMWVLVFLLATLAGQRDRLRMAITAGTFVVVSGVMYFAFMAAWLNVFLLLGLSRAVQVVLGCLALAIGLINTKDFLAFRVGFSLSIPDRVKPRLYARVRSVLHAQTWLSTLLGVAILAVLVNFVELLCTAGFPAVFTSVLASRELSTMGRMAFLALYNVAYVFDDALMVTVAVVTLSRGKLTERTGRWLKLVSGLVMLGLGLALLLRPDLLR
jgi:glutaredoxin